MRYLSLSRPSFLVCPLHNFHFLPVAERKTAAIGLQKGAIDCHPLRQLRPPTLDVLTYLTLLREFAHTSSCYPYLPRGKGLANARNDPQETLRGDQWRFRWFLATQCLLSPKALAEAKDRRGLPHLDGAALRLGH